jgi:cyclophilin family peptidyl-prolyl cis-trans isomerase
MITKIKKKLPKHIHKKVSKFTIHILFLSSIIFLILGLIIVYNVSKYHGVSNKPKTIVFQTTKGDVTIELDNRSINTVNNFINLSKTGFYNGTKFHRVIKGLMIQGGDPFTKQDITKTLWGHGGPGYVFKDEFHKDDKMVRGVVAMANNGPNTNGSQFFILTAEKASLYEGRNTIFGHVIKGMDIVEAISEVPASVTDVPKVDIILKKVYIFSSH